MDSFKAQQVMTGTEGEVWIDSQYMAQVTSFKAQVKLIKTEVNQVKVRAKQYKVTGWEGSGSVKMNHVSSYFVQKRSDNIKNGHQTVCEIVAKVSDPDAVGAERVAIHDATFDTLVLMNWEAKKLMQDDVNFTFTDYDILDTASDN